MLPSAQTPQFQLVQEFLFSSLLNWSLSKGELRMRWGGRVWRGLVEHACYPSCELFLRHALTTTPPGGMFCGVGLPPRPPETIPSPPQSGPKFNPARYYSTSRVTPSSLLTVSHCPEYHQPPPRPARRHPHPLLLVCTGRR